MLHGACHCGDTHGARVPPVVPEYTSTKDRSAYARTLWEQAADPQGTAVEVYLRGRGINISSPFSLRFHEALIHKGSGRHLAAMVAAVTRWPGDQVAGIHRTYIKPDGSGKADVYPNKMSLGPISGGAVRLGSPAHEMAVSEGIEDGMTVLQETGMVVWAATGASSLRSMVLPDLPMAAEVVVCSHPDPIGQRAASAATERWISEGRSVRVAVPEDGMDFNDVLRG